MSMSARCINVTTVVVCHIEWNTNTKHNTTENICIVYIYIYLSQGAVICVKLCERMKNANGFAVRRKFLYKHNTYYI